MYKLKSIFIISLIIILFISAVNGTIYGIDVKKSFSQYVHEVWMVKNGLPQNSVQAICQTPDGYLWIGTEAGLARFDGIDFKIYNNQNTKQITNNDIMALEKDDRGNLWIGTHGGGLVKYKNDQFTHYTTRDGLPSDIIMSLHNDRKGNTWIGTGGGLSCFSDGKFISFTKNNGLNSDVVMAICEDSSGTIWIGTYGGGINLYRNHQFSALTENDGLSSNNIRSIFEDRDGNVWIGTERAGLIRYHDGSFSTLSTNQGLSNNTILSIFEDSRGNLLIGTNGGGINYFIDGELAHYSSRQGLSNDIIRSIYEDMKGNLWIGTRGGGLNRLSEGKFITFTRNEGLSDDLIRSVYEDSEGILWVGTNHGLNYKNGEKFMPFAEKYLSKSTILSILKDSGGNLWIGTYGDGIFRYMNGKWSDFTLKLEHGNDIVNALFEDHQGKIWIGTLGRGLTSFHNGRFSFYTTKEGLYSNIIYCIYEDQDYNLWIGTGIGLNCIKNNQVTSYPMEEVLSSKIVFSLYQDEEGKLWMATNGSGLKWLKGSELKSCSTKEGLFADKIYSLFEDNQKNLWMSCAKGVFSVNKNDLDSLYEGKRDTVNCKFYDESDGMKTRECSGSNQPVGWKSQDGKLWFATYKGLTMIDPENIQINKVPPRIDIECIVVDGKVIFPSQKTILSPGKHNLVFHYRPLSLSSPNYVKFKYMLKGVDKDWINVGFQKERSASYFGLSHGNYCFKVLAATKDDIWNETGDEIEFFIEPHFYQTDWFYLLCLLFVLFTGFGSFQFYKWKKKIRQKNRYKTSTLSDEKAEEYLNKLLTIIKTEKPFIDSELNLSKLADILSIPRLYLSQIINIRLKRHFNDFINYYRTEEAKKRILDPKYKHLKLIAIGFDVGFNSKSSFNSSFKKHTGMTPSEFRTKHSNQ